MKRILRWWHNYLRLRSREEWFYLWSEHEFADDKTGKRDTWLTTCSTTGSLMWTYQIGRAERFHHTEAVRVLNTRADSLLYTPGEWADKVADLIANDCT